MLCLLLRPSHFALILMHTLTAGLMAACLAGMLGIGACILPSEGWVVIHFAAVTIIIISIQRLDQCRQVLSCDHQSWIVYGSS